MPRAIAAALDTSERIGAEHCRKAHDIDRCDKCDIRPCLNPLDFPNARAKLAELLDALRRSGELTDYTSDDDLSNLRGRLSAIAAQVKAGS